MSRHVVPFLLFTALASACGGKANNGDSSSALEAGNVTPAPNTPAANGETTSCEPIANSCAPGCIEISAPPYYPDQMCQGADTVVLGCVVPTPSGAGPTGDATCVQSPDGVVYNGISGTYRSHLKTHGDFVDCDPDVEQAAYVNQRTVCPATTSGGQGGSAAVADGACPAMDVELDALGACQLRMEPLYYFDGAHCARWWCEDCGNTDCAALFADEASCEAAYADCATPTGYGPCTTSEDCGNDGFCFAGTCGALCNASGECSAFEQCSAPDPMSCLPAPVVGPGLPPVSGPGACLPKCRVDADCQEYNADLSCWGGACVQQLPECYTNCEPIADSCAPGCQEIAATPYYPDQMCRGAAPVVLGCTVLQGATADATCVQSADGVIYNGISGTYRSHLKTHGDYTDCDPDVALAAYENQQDVCP